jgi:hypothetical protein
MMEIDPHTLQQILHRIYQQMRCPQCGRRVPVDFSSVQVVADAAILLQLRCDSCNTYIVLQASLQGMEQITGKPYEYDVTANVSSSMEMSNDEMVLLHSALEQHGGSFEALFKEVHIEEDKS